MKHWLLILMMPILAAAASPTTGNATLSWGEIAYNSTTGTYTASIVLNTTASTYAGQVAGLQFDLNYNPSLYTLVGCTSGTGNCLTTNLGGTMPSGLSATTISLPAANNPFCATDNTNYPTCSTGGDTATGLRAIIIGCCSTAQTTSGTPASAVFDCNPLPTTGCTSATQGVGAAVVVATLTIHPLATPNAAGTWTLTLPSAYMVGTTQGGSSTAALAVPTVNGAGPIDPTGSGTIDLYNFYLVGDVYNSSSPTYPPANEMAPNFGTFGKVTLNDVLWTLYVSTTAYTAPQTCTDFYDAMNAYPYDTPTCRGGLTPISGNCGTTQEPKIVLNDVLAVLYYSTGAYSPIPMRASLGGCSQSGAAATANLRRAVPAPAPEVGGSLVLGPAESSGGQDRVPVYLEGSRDLSGAALGFTVGDQKSQLQFQAGAQAPSLTGSSAVGMITAAWLQGLDVRAGQRLLLGYVVGPAGFAPGLRVFGVSATGKNDYKEIGLNVSGAPLVQQ